MKPVRSDKADGHQVKICVDCAHHTEHPDDGHVCAKAINPITGLEALCVKVRSDNTLCGELGSWFEFRQNVRRYVETATTFTYTESSSEGNEPLAKPSLGQKYEEDDPGIMSRVHGSDNKIKPFTDYTSE